MIIKLSTVRHLPPISPIRHTIPNILKPSPAYRLTPYRHINRGVRTILTPLLFGPPR